MRPTKAGALLLLLPFSAGAPPVLRQEPGDAGVVLAARLAPGPLQ